MRWRTIAVTAVACSLASPGWAEAADDGLGQAMALHQLGRRALDLRRAQGVAALWPKESAAAAARAMERYGIPDQISELELAWNDRYPFLRVAVLRDGGHDAPYPLVQSVPYVARADTWRELEAFDRRVRYDPGMQALVVSSAREETNLLALNLADEIVRGVKTGAQAREVYDRTLGLSYSGKSSPLMKKLRFKPDWRAPR